MSNTGVIIKFGFRETGASCAQRYVDTDLIIISVSIQQKAPITLWEVVVTCVYLLPSYTIFRILINSK